MARGVRKWSEAAIKRLEKQGRGQGNGVTYQPWIDALDGSSSGNVTRIPGIKTNRVHQLLSRLELRTLYMLEHAKNVTDIREQFPLDRAITTQLALEAGISHPIYPGTSVPVVMTTDFLVSFERNGKVWQSAFDVKPAEELNKLRVLEKLELARRYWALKSATYHLVLDCELSMPLTHNLELLRPHVGVLAKSADEDVARMLELMPRFLREMRQAARTESLESFSIIFAARHHAAEEEIFRLAMCLIADGRMQLDLNCPDLLRSPITSIRNLAKLLPELHRAGG